MRRTLLVVSLALSALPAAQSGAAELLIDLRDDTGDADEAAIESAIHADLKLNSIQAKEERFFLATVDDADVERDLALLTKDPRVEHAELNGIYEASFVPDDPRYKEQWDLKMVKAEEAWDTARGKGAVVAVIDTGVAYVSEGRFKRVEDLEGTKFQKGYDFVNDDDVAGDDHGHGTHVAGTIAQATDNGLGVAGLAFEATIMPIKVLNAQGRGTTADIVDAIRFAADEGAQVINMSLGGGMYSPTMAAAVAYARKKGVVVVCAAGNGSRGTVEYPAAYPGAFAVSAVGPDGTLASYSSWGKEVAIAAPGGDKQKGGEAAGVIQNTIIPGDLNTTNRYLSFQGTSMATPHVAAAAALIISAGVTDADEVEKILKSSARPAKEGPSQKYGAGLLDAAAAVEAAGQQTHGGTHLLTGLGLLALVAAATRRSGVRLGLKAIAGVVLAASGLYFFPRLGLFSMPIATWDLFAFGPSGFRTALYASFLPMLGAAVVFLGARRWQGLIIGLVVGFAANLLVGAVLMPSDVQLIPGLSSILDRLWLVLNAVILILLALLLRRRASA